MSTKLSLLLPSAFFLAVTAAPAADYTIVAPSPSGSGWDQLAQAMKAIAGDRTPSDRMEVVNVPGLGGTVGLTRFLTETTPGVLVTGLTMLDATLVQRAPTSLDRMTPLARVATEPFAVAVPAASPFTTIDELKAAMWTEAGKVTWAGGPSGSIDHVAAALFARAIGVDPSRLNYVPFLATADAVAAIADDKVSAAIVSRSEVVNEQRAGRLRLLAVAAAEREGEVPTLAESGIPLMLGNWRGLVARPGLPETERRRLADLVASIVAAPGWQALLDRKGWKAGYLGPEAFGAFLRDEQARVKDALKATGR